MTSILYNKKNKYILILAIFSIVLVTNSSYAIVSQTRDFYVNDSANLLSDETEDYIINMNKTLEEQTGAQIVVVTVKNLEGQSLEEYATELFREYGIGDKEKNNGVLLLCAYEERQFRIEVGYGLEGTLTDGKTGRIQDEYIIPYLKENNFNNGIRNGFNAVLKEVENEYGITIEGAEEGNVVGTTNARTNVASNVAPHIIMMVIFILVVIFFSRRGIFFIGGFGGGHFGGRRLIWWRWFLWRRRIFRWRRLIKKFLKINIGTFFGDCPGDLGTFLKSLLYIKPVLIYFINTGLSFSKSSYKF